MPTKKTDKKLKKSILDESFSIQTLMKGSDSYKSLIYGIVTVVVLFVVIALGIKSLSQNRAQIDNEAVSTQNTVRAVQDKRYEVQEGETLWSIAQKSYNDGFKWTEIAKANDITDPQSLSSGTKLIIPTLPKTGDTAVITPEVTPAPTMTEVSSGAKITGLTYNVVYGDNLWDIAVRAYGDGYRWSDIANLNKLAEPDLIFTGNVLNLPRP